MASCADLTNDVTCHQVAMKERIQTTLLPMHVAPSTELQRATASSASRGTTMLRRAVTLSVASSTSARGTGLGTVGLLHHLCQQYGRGH
jgi:hypothetical protein